MECSNKLLSRKTVKDKEIFDIVESDGIDVWGHNQDDIELQALSHLKSLAEVENSKEDESLKEDGEICDNNCDIEEQISSRKSSVANAININKYLDSQAQLQICHIHKKNSFVSEKSKVVANKLSELNLRKHVKTSNSLKQNKKLKLSTDIVCEHDTSKKSGLHHNSDSDYYPSDEYESDSSIYETATDNMGTKRKRTYLKKHNLDEKTKDDGLLTYYINRLKIYNEKKIDLEVEEYIQDNLKIPRSIWEKLYTYQQEGIKWLWNLNKQTIGGLLGDEMGLGKTVQVITFLCALEYSKIKSCNGRYCGLGPSIVVCPATVINQWVKHFHDWWPPFRVALLHQSGTYSGNKTQLINDIHKSNGILVTTYESILKYKGVLVEKNWHYLILDEGHKIRNPNAKITVAVKDFRTPHKLILTGSPMQNNLQELWSLYDFIVPGKLGSQQAFMDYFVTPIVHGGYVNATPTQETTALLIATSLRDMINPFMLRRTKDEVKDSIYLPNKSEQVLFCSLTDEQKDLYRGYLLSDHVGSILGRTTVRVSENQGRANMLVGITTLRKICNHPDLYLGEAEEVNDPNTNEVIPVEKTFGYYKRSGKMIVVAALLKIWKKQGHRVLLFTQTRSMVDIFEDFLTREDYKYLKMDGATSIGNRQSIIDEFNQNTSYDVFLLTTRVGGLGVNLTGADRVVIYDPDWNPATDTQARERAWRIGQLKQVTVYRLVSAGTIEEKMYQRQIWKQLLSNKILIDPRTKRFFKTSDLTDLFSLQEQTDNNPETAKIFKNSKIEVNVSNTSSIPNSSITFTKEKIDAMKTLAQQIAKNILPKEQKRNYDATISEDKSINRPTPAELLAINRKKLEIHEDPIVNKLDDCKTNSAFSEALVVAAERSTTYHKIDNKIPPEEDKIKNKKKKEENKVKIDNSGQINGERIEGLIKREVKKKEKLKNNYKTNQDDYVLKKLFSKKGVHTALQHDVIIQSGNPHRNNLKIHYEAKKKADMALKAIRKSRMNNWRW